MDMKIELLSVPVADIDRAKDFYVRAGFVADHDTTVDEQTRFVQLTPPGSACSIAFGTGLGIDLEPGQQNTIQVVVPDAAEARAHLIANGVEASEVDPQAWGNFVTFADPDGNTWTLQELPKRD